jgi:hypothetical protein
MFLLYNEGLYRSRSIVTARDSQGLSMPLRTTNIYRIIVENVRLADRDGKTALRWPLGKQVVNVYIEWWQKRGAEKAREN